jgi:cytochrome oxidase Cu insertion factor (SCO1/SenC/PrrC family)
LSRIRLAVLVLALGALAGVGIGIIVASLTGRAQAQAGLPDLHGQASWAPRERRAPSFALPDQSGRRVSLAALRRPVLLTFLDSRCHGQCPIEGRQLGTMLRRMAPAARPTLLIVGVNPSGDTPTSIRHVMRNWRLAGPWRWHWLRGTRRELEGVWRAYGIRVEPTTNDVTHGMALYLIDRRGFERAGYLFPFLPNFVALDLHTLAEEQT